MNNLNIKSKENKKVGQISIAVVILIRPNVNELSFRSLESFFNINHNENINKYITIPEESFPIIKDKLDANYKYKIILQPSNIDLGRNKLQFINQEISEDYVVFLHDDDLYSDEIAEKAFEILSQFKPSALAFKATTINFDDFILSKRNSYSPKKIIKVNSIDILKRYFLPFEKCLIAPSIFYKSSDLKEYWKNCPNTIGPHEDVKMNYFLAKIGLFLEIKDIRYYFYRIHCNQDSSNLNSKSRLKLIVWLKSLKINSFLKLFFVTSSFLQYLVFNKKISLKPKFLETFLKRSRNKIITYRAGGKASSKTYKELIN